MVHCIVHGGFSHGRLSSGLFADAAGNFFKFLRQHSSGQRRVSAGHPRRPPLVWHTMAHCIVHGGLSQGRLSSGLFADAARNFFKFLQKHSSGKRMFSTGHPCRPRTSTPLEDYTGQMSEAATVNSVSHVPFLQWCGQTSMLAEGKCAHHHIVTIGHDHVTMIANHLIQMYSDFNACEDALLVFTSLHCRNTFSWNLIIKLCPQIKQEDSSKLYERMLQEGVLPTDVTYATVLDKCIDEVELDVVRHMHARIANSQIEEDVVVGTALVNLYGRCNSLATAGVVFSRIRAHNIISWTAIINTYGQNGQGKEALEFYTRMQQEGMLPNKLTFASTLAACADHAALLTGMHLHACMHESDCRQNVLLGTALLNMYGKCNSLDYSRLVFEEMSERNVVAWSAMIAVYSKYGQGNAAFDLFNQMQGEQIVPNEITYVGILAACTNPLMLEHGQWLHHCIQTRRLELDIVVGTAVLNMYSKCGSLEDAQLVFRKLPKRDTVVWNAMISVYAEHGWMNKTLHLFNLMQRENVKPNNASFVSILDVCAIQATLDKGKAIHHFIIESHLESDTPLGNALINMYGRCASLEDALRIFSKMLEHNVVSWSSMIAVFAHHGCGHEALKLFEQIPHKESMADTVIFVNVLVGCSHSGLVEEAYSYFCSMCQGFGILPMVDHYVCLIDAIGKAGQIYEAEILLNNMPFVPVSASLMAFLSAHRFHADIDAGIMCAG